MRLDKFLKLNRIIKRRTLAKDAIEKGFVLKNGRPAKPASEINPGDEIQIDFANRVLVIRVMENMEIEVVREEKRF
ncbi:tRNA synthetase RNA-binding protein [Kosmotoga pacifica]|uniref:tRNA synthetase RNA-binding protein n=1 Tax=Kosmotoga pacifica TaxID=1330330 RepID=A0A0G2ZCD5_9BACT|nr:tRNA synthetase RNA-binding protein [Kosmotoga pacifica]